MLVTTEIEVPGSVDVTEARNVIRKVLEGMAEGQRVGFLVLPGDVPDTAMPRIMAAATQAARSVAFEALLDRERTEPIAQG